MSCTRCMEVGGLCRDCEEYLYPDEPGFDFDEDCEGVSDRMGCLFPNECLMPGEHLESECHTVEMMEQLCEDGTA